MMLMIKIKMTITTITTETTMPAMVEPATNIHT
jgi:hypothetical protein